MSSSSFNTSSMSSAISDYAERLKCIYGNALINDDSKWPPTPSKKFIRLALTEHCRSSKEAIDNIMKGDVKELLEDRQEVSIEQVLQLKDEGKFQLLLIEGAPGIGKSTLSWELCRNWEIFPCMKQYRVVVLLRLRDIEVQNIEDIAGLFEKKKAVADEVDKVYGKGVLFILDGFDELPLKLQKDGFLIKKLISGKALPKSTVLVTSRPSATAIFLTSCRPLLKKRIEVLGFTLERVEEYADSVFQDSKMLSEFRTYISASKNPAINSLMYVPLNAAIVVQLYQDRSTECGPMPNTMTQLYTQLCFTMIKRRFPDLKPFCHFKDLPDDRYKEFLDLSKIAYEGIADQRVIFYNLDSSLEHFGFLDAVTSLSGCGPISYNFLHLTLQEFLAAYHISQLDKQNSAEEQKDGGHWNIVRRFVSGLTKSVPEFDPLNLTPELILCLYEAQCSADYVLLCGGECSLDSEIRQPLQAYALGYCIANSAASWKHIGIIGAIALDSFVWGVRSKESPCGGGIRDMSVNVGEGEQLAANHFKDAPLSGLSCLRCSGGSDTLSKISQAIPVMTRLEELDISDLRSDNLRLSKLFLQLVCCNVNSLILPSVRNESLQEYCSALHKLIGPSSSGKLVKLKLDFSHISASKVLNIILAPSSLQTVSLVLDVNCPSLDLSSTCTNTNITKLTCGGVVGGGIIPAHVVVEMMERNRALQELIVRNFKVLDQPSFLLYCYDIIKGIPECSSLERVEIGDYFHSRSLMMECREEVEDFRERAKTQSADSFIKLVTEKEK